MNRKRSSLLLVLLLVAAPAIVEAGTGCADFTKFVAIGDSLVSGECNASVVETFQASAFSRLIEKFAPATCISARARPTSAAWNGCTRRGHMPERNVTTAAGLPLRNPVWRGVYVPPRRAATCCHTCWR